MQNMEQHMNVLNTLEHSHNKKVSEHECFRLLWIKVILRAAYDWVLYRNSKSHIAKKIADDAHRWLFDPPYEKRHIQIGKITRIIHQQEFNSLENVCDAIDLNIDSVRKFANSLTRDMVKKMEFLERSSKKSLLKSPSVIEINNDSNELP